MQLLICFCVHQGAEYGRGEAAATTLYSGVGAGFNMGMRVVWFLGIFWLWVSSVTAGQFVVVSFNLENFVGPNEHRRPVKTAEAKAKIVDCLLLARPDVLAVQEIGKRGRLLELQQLLKARGVDLPELFFVDGPDPAINLGVLSRFPMRGTAHEKVRFVLGRKRFEVSRGFAEVEVMVSEGYSFTLLNVHLKSKRPVGFASEAMLRLREAEALRALVEKRLAEASERNLLVVGDLNDSPGAAPVKAVIGRGKDKLLDLRPFERNGDATPSVGRKSPRRITWTAYYAAEDRFSRFDYLLASKGMARELVPAGTYVLAVADWGLASDHRPIVAQFKNADE
ncbi:MAG: hypothetical protein CMO74_12630 [Verrucomicrobiales bacterium]|nr:hypothetical protein [Verrucomicrobiales bacterium]